jgi:hypothetical protein
MITGLHKSQKLPHVYGFQARTKVGDLLVNLHFSLGTIPNLILTTKIALTHKLNLTRFLEGQCRH